LSAKGGLMMGTKKVGAPPPAQESHFYYSTPRERQIKAEILKGVALPPSKKSLYGPPRGLFS